MNTDEDVQWVRDALGPADPVRDGLDLEEDVRAVRHRVGQTSHLRLGRVAAGLLVVVLAISSLVPMARAPAAWAVEEDPQMGTVIRVELPEFFQRGADPDEVVAALREHEVDVDVVDQLDLTPWKAGRVVGTGFELRGVSREFAEAFTDPERRDEGDFSEAGITLLDSGGFKVHPDTFEGTVEIRIGRLPGQSATAAHLP